ncbi:MAG: ATP-dependent Clp protease ATP-binding subunit [Patescibacteria group bacterium]
MNNIFKKFTPNLKKTLVEAEKIAKERNSATDTDHELLSLLKNKETLAFEILSGFEISADRIELITSLISHQNHPSDTMSKDAKKAIQLAVQYAAKYDHQNVGSEHLLLALVSNKNFNSYLIIERAGINPKKIKDQIESIFAGINRSFSQADTPTDQMNAPESMGGDFEEIGFMGPGQMPQFSETATKSGKKDSMLDSFSTNLTKLAHEHKLDPVIGRTEEMMRLAQTLSRRTKNNPILIGEPGVGKTSIVEGLAQRIAEGRVPGKLQGTEIYSIDLGSILAGTMYRGQFESRIKKILAEIEKRGNIILFVDEIHMMVGAGSTEGSIDAANLLKPMLAKGKLRLIGSTTYDEYKKHIEKDMAFERRFQPIKIEEPTIPETIKILAGLKEHYENFHNVRYTPDALEAAVYLSKRYINDRHLPDKAIDLIDEAGAAANNTRPSDSDQLVKLKQELALILKKKENKISKEDYEGAALLRTSELKLEKKIKEAGNAEEGGTKIIITDNDIAGIISTWTGVPTVTLTSEEKKIYSNLDERLKKYIIGQDLAISELAKAIKRSRVGIANPNRPIGSFMFLGPTGVGKTELAKVLAKEIFGNEKALIRIDMSEFMEKHNVARMIGAPAGYVGYEEGGRLTDAVRKNPHSVILFDEIEKAHPEVFNILLQILEDGSLTDAKGRKVDFKNTVVIMTSNLGTDVLRQQTSIGFNNSLSSKERYQKLESSVIEKVEKSFRPEFLNRLDKIIVFYPLDEKTLLKIVELQIKELNTRLVAQGYSLNLDPKVKKFIAKESYKPEFGARPIRKYIAENVESIISDAILSDQIIKDKRISLDLQNDQIILI